MGYIYIYFVLFYFVLELEKYIYRGNDMTSKISFQKFGGRNQFGCTGSKIGQGLTTVAG